MSSKYFNGFCFLSEQTLHCTAFDENQIEEASCNPRPIVQTILSPSRKAQSRETAINGECSTRFVQNEYYLSESTARAQNLRNATRPDVTAIAHNKSHNEIEFLKRAREESERVSSENRGSTDEGIKPEIYFLYVIKVEQHKYLKVRLRDIP